MVFGKFKDKIADIYKDKYHDDSIHFDSTEIWACYIYVLLNDNTSVEFLDTLEYGKEAIMYSMLLSMLERTLIEVKEYLDEPIKLLYKLTMSVIMKNHNITEIIDTLGGIVKERYTDKDKLKIPDWADIKRIIYGEDYIHLKHLIFSICKDNSRVDMMLNLLDIVMNEDTIFPVDHYLDLSCIEWVKDKDYSLHMNLYLNDQNMSYIDRYYDSRISIFDTEGYWDIDLLRKYYLNISDKYIYDNYYNPKENIDFLYSITKTKKSDLSNNIIIDSVFSYMNKVYDDIDNRVTLRIPNVYMNKDEYFKMREYYPYTKYEYSDFNMSFLDFIRYRDDVLGRSNLNLTDKADIRFIFHPDLYFNINDSIYIDKDLSSFNNRFKLIDTMTYNIPYEFFNRFLFNEYYHYDLHYDILSRFDLAYHLTETEDMNKDELLRIEMYMNDFISNIKYHDDLICNASLHVNSHNISINHQINLDNLMDMISNPSSFIEKFSIEDLIEHDSSTGFLDRLVIQFRCMTDRVEWNLENHNLNMKNEIEWFRQYKYSYGMEINQSLHSNNSIKTKEPVEFKDTLQILYID